MITIDSPLACPVLMVFPLCLPFQLCGLLERHNNQTRPYEATVALISLLFRQGKSPLKILGFEMYGAYHRALGRLPLGSFLLYEFHPFLPSSLGFRTIVLKKRNHVQRYASNFVFLVATTSGNANRRHFLRTQFKINE